MSLSDLTCLDTGNRIMRNQIGTAMSTFERTEGDRES